MLAGTAHEEKVIANLVVPFSNLHTVPMGHIPPSGSYQVPFFVCISLLFDFLCLWAVSHGAFSLFIS